ncbi:hypothetical protein FM076_32000 [Streptomyces albus subsp. chlorinus]|uniref:hypothetical protein n=1 Tax=Streptomyces albus TaxID=1888 RepID=UPI00156ECAC7|nr:hypothetical protein [Streptomyces albus]NSC25532.1 hypothetical protein [Streptomyces albus subsp. chlorinus]
MTSNSTREDRRPTTLCGIVERSESAHDTEPAFRLTAPPVPVGPETVDIEAQSRTTGRESHAYLERHSLEPPGDDWAAFEKLIAEVRAEARER